MKEIRATESVTIPEGVSIKLKSRQVQVTGPRGVLSKSFKHANIEMHLRDAGKRVECVGWFFNTKQKSALRTVCSHINNLVIGVTQGFRYKMRLVYAHFPINISINDTGKTVEIRNFLGEHITRTVNMNPGVTIERSETVKDELVLEGNDIENVSLSAAQIHQKTLVRRKDIRKFLDGVYVSEAGPMNNMKAV